MAVAIDGVPYVTTPVTTSRPDVCSALGNYPGCPNVGWQFSFDTTTLTDGSHVLQATAMTADNRASSASVGFYVTNQHYTTISIDAPAGMRRFGPSGAIGGWVMDDASSLNSVYVLIDGIPFGNAGLNSRQDVCDAYGSFPGCPNVGWTYWLDVTSLSNGIHVISAKATLSNGQPVTQSQEFIVNNGTAGEEDAAASYGDAGQLTCKDYGQAVKSGLDSRTPDSQGIIQVTYKITGNDAMAADAMNAAVNSWNAHTSQTGVHFTYVSNDRLPT